MHFLLKSGGLLGLLLGFCFPLAAMNQQSYVSPKDKIFSIGLPNFFATILAANSRKEWVLAKLANLPFKEVETVYLRELEEVEIDNDSDMEFEEIDEEES